MQIKVIHVVIATLIALIAITTLVFFSANSYKKPVENFVKGIRKADAQTIIDCIYTDATSAELRIKAKDSGIAWDDYIDKSSDAIETGIDNLGVKKLKAEIIAKEEISGSNLTNIENFYKETYGVEIKKAYRVEVEFTFKKNKEKVTRSGWLCVTKIKGDGWKFCPEYSQNSFDFIDVTLNSFK